MKRGAEEPGDVEMAAIFMADRGSPDQSRQGSTIVLDGYAIVTDSRPEQPIET